MLFPVSSQSASYRDTIEVVLYQDSKVRRTIKHKLLCPYMGKIWTVTVRSNKTDYRVDFEVFDKTCILTHVPETVEGVFTIPEWIYSDKGMIRDVTGIGEGAFINCPNLTGVIIPDTITRVLDGAFDNCPNLVVIKGIENVPYVSQQAFIRCSKLNGDSVKRDISRVDEEDRSHGGTMSASIEALTRRIEHLESKTNTLTILMAVVLILLIILIL